jgi:hypothetical protein
MLQSLGVANGSLAQQLLKFPAVVQGPLDIGHEFIGDIDGHSPSFQPDIEDMTVMLFAAQASFTVLTDAPGTTEAERSQGGWPKAGSLFLEPMDDICGSFFFNWH